MSSGRIYRTALLAKMCCAFLYPLRLQRGHSQLTHSESWHRIIVRHVFPPERSLMQQAVQQVEAQFAKEMGAEAREKRIDR